VEQPSDALRAEPPRRAVALVGALIAVLVVANNIGNLSMTTLARDHPAVLLALNSTNRMLGLTTNQLDAWSYYGIGAARLLVADPLFFLLGRWYGDAAIRWVERKWASQGEMLRMFERGFQRAAYAFVFVAPNNVVCLLAGAGSMSVAGFFAANIAGTFTRLFLIRRAGEALSSPLDAVLDVFDRYRWQLLALSFVAVAASFLSDRRRGSDELHAVEELEQIEDEIEEEMEEP
jgi:membrane protein DedA with SNARE-associated domain